VLRLATQGLGRSEFLRETSRLLLDFSACQALELHADLGNGGSRYRWSAGRSPQESFDFESLATGESAACTVATTASIAARPRAWFDELVQSVLRAQIGPRSRCVTAHGSFWTGDAVSDLALSEQSYSSPAVANLEVGSIAIIPFDVAPTIPAVLALLSGRKHAFSAQNIEFYEALAQTLGLAIDDRRAQHALRERVKELSCLYAIAQVLEGVDATVPEALATIVQIIPPAWQFPDRVVARIRLDDREFSTGETTRIKYSQEAAVVVEGTIRGLVEVGYVQDHPEFVEGPFLKEEEHLISAIAREVSLFVLRSEVRIEKQRLAEKVRQADRLATIGHLAATVAHEINEPLGGILGFAQLAHKAPGVPDKVVKDLGKIVQETLHAREIVRKFMLFARQSPSTRSWVRVNDTVEDSLTLLAARFTEHGVKVVRDLDPARPGVFADAVQLHQVVVNLCVNGIQAMPRGGTLAIRTRGSADSVSIIVEDTGTGIPPEVRERLFEPFFTTKNPEQGTGLGLSVVHGIVTSHGGTITFDTEQGAGTRFEVRLPTSSPSHDQKGQAANG
jgi:signal transduction histidine kinase